MMQQVRHQSLHYHRWYHICGRYVSRAQLCKGLPLIQAIFTRLSVEMHGTRTESINEETGETKEKLKVSKTECAFFAPPDYFKQRGIQAGVSASNLLSLDGSNDEPDGKKEKRVSKEDSMGF